jgi:putative tricarboxylic transport membrane protein
MGLFFDTLGNATSMLADPSMLLAIAVGSLIGSIAGAMPGITTTLAVGVALPFTFTVQPEAAVAFLVAITVGVNYGNSIPAVLVGVPGTPAAVLTAIDGYKLHQRGNSGLALGAQYIAALTGQFISTFFFVAAVVPLAQLLYIFLAPELWALMLMGFVAIISLTGKNVFKGLVAAGLGLVVTFIGRDPVALTGRFTFDIPELRSGLTVVPVVIGVLAVSELIRSCRQVYGWDEASSTGYSGRFPTGRQIRRMIRPIWIGTFWGTVTGAIPGGGGTSSSFIAYQQAKATSKAPEEFGNGSVEGIAANESAQNASQSGEMVPTFGFGIPASGSMVLLLAALTVHGLVPGPLLIRETPEMLYAATSALFGGTLVLLIIGWPLARAMLKLVLLDRSVVLIMALLLSMVGVYALRNSIFDVGTMLVFGLIGYFMLRYGYSTAAFALTVTLGSDFESYLRHGLLLADGSFKEFITRPVTAVLVVISLLLLLHGVLSTIRQSRRIAKRRMERESEKARAESEVAEAEVAEPKAEADTETVTETKTETHEVESPTA